MSEFDWRALAHTLLDEAGMGLTSEQYIANLCIALREFVNRLEHAERALVTMREAFAMSSSDEENRLRVQLVEDNRLIASLRTRLAEAEQQRDTLVRGMGRMATDNIAYRGALGHPIPGEHDGRLCDGTTPHCGLCEAKDLLLTVAEQRKCDNCGCTRRAP